MSLSHRSTPKWGPAPLCPSCPFAPDLGLIRPSHRRRSRLATWKKTGAKKAQAASSVLTGRTFGSRPTSIRALASPPCQVGLEGASQARVPSPAPGGPGPGVSGSCGLPGPFPLSPAQNAGGSVRGRGSDGNVRATEGGVAPAGHGCRLPSSSALGRSVGPRGDVRAVSGGRALRPLPGNQAEARARRLQAPRRWQLPVTSAGILSPSKQDPNLACLFRSERSSLRTRGASGEVIYSCSSFRDGK